MSFRTMAAAFALVLALGSVAVALASGERTDPASASPARQQKTEANSKDKLSADDFRKVGAGDHSGLDASGDDLFDDSVGTKDDDDWDDEDAEDDDWDDDDTGKDSKHDTGSGDSGHTGDSGGSTG